MDHQPPADSGALPAISDYWPDAPHRMGPAADHYDFNAPRVLPAEPPAPGAIPLPEPAPRRRTGLVVTLVLLVLAAGGGFVLWDRDPLGLRPARDVAQRPAPAVVPERSSDAGGGDGPAEALTAPVNDRTSATFELVSDASLVRLRTDDLSGGLYRIAAPQGSSVRPRAVEADGTVRLFLDPTGRAGDEEIDVVLAEDVRWRLTVTGGVRRGELDLGGAEVDRVTLAGDAAELALTLPKPDGTLPIRMSGGVDQFEIRTDRGVPVRLRMRRGAGEVTFDGRKDDGVARGAAFQNDAWKGSRDRVDVDAVAGVGSLRLARQ